MYFKKILMILGAIAIILFIAWFYFGQLGSFPLEPEFIENITSTQNDNAKLMNSKTDEISGFDLTRMDSQGAVGVEATILPERSSSNELIFQIVMNTHSIDLLQYPLDELARLSFSSIENPSGEFKWELTNDDSHHLVGYLKWKGSVIEDNIILKINNIDNIPSRTFEWEQPWISKAS
ncbi:hypothetical protein [Niallia oryzisoli]|uniref:hypothetical protein n=1 Tax=Niallia oryzisoli TaxID=1737571 RepID=UPI003734DB48